MSTKPSIPPEADCLHCIVSIAIMRWSARNGPNGKVEPIEVVGRLAEVVYDLAGTAEERCPGGGAEVFALAHALLDEFEARLPLFATKIPTRGDH